MTGIDIIFDNTDVEKEYARWCSHFGEEDPYQSTDTIGLFDVLRAHFLVVDHFYGKDEGLGGVGPRSPDLLHSAIYRQFVSFGGKDKWANPYEKAATLIFGLVKDHPFHDANKRTGLLTLLLFWTKINRTPTVNQKDLEDFVVDIAEGNLKKYRRQRDLQRKTDDPEVRFIADYLKRHSRKRDNRYYTITYRELDKRLREFGYCLTDPSGNFINVVREEERRKLLGFGKREQIQVKVAQIGFPGWKSQVGKGAISTVRRAAKLTPEDGFDSETFFHGADPVQSLIAEYVRPLERLAHR